MNDNGIECSQFGNQQCGAPPLRLVMVVVGQYKILILRFLSLAHRLEVAATTKTLGKLNCHTWVLVRFISIRS